MKLNEAKIQNFYGVTFGSDLGEKQALVRIPHYQRPYRWPESYIKTLISDWDNEQKSEYFAGAIVTVLSNKGVHQLVDGQQRYTTVFLVNYTCFLLVRTAIREAISLNRTARIDSLLQSYRKCSQFLYSNFDFEKYDEFTESILTKVDKLNETDDEIRVNEIREDLLKTCANEGLFPLVNEGELEFEYEFKKMLESSMSSHEIRLSYDRSIFNTKLNTALINMIVKLDNHNEQSIITFDAVDPNEEPVICQYQNSISVIFEHFGSLTIGNEPFTKALNTIKNIELFLQKVKFCVIQTGNEEDAYTLFEVLNDRALALDDLDLIKNQFYKKFCKSNEGESERLIDICIENRELQWGENIFPDGMKLGNKSIVSYIVSSYLSGDTDHLIQSSEKNREKITAYLEKRDTYGTDDFECDFNLLQAATSFVNCFDIWHKSKNKKALKAEYSNNFSPTYKLVHLLSALNQQGVLVGLTNVILLYIKTYVSSTYDPNRVEKFYSELIGNSSNHKDIHALSNRIWKLVMQSPSAEFPREYAIELIQQNTYFSNDVNFLERDFLTFDLKVSLEKWLDDWRYNRNDIKVCVLFARLIKLSINEENRLVNKQFGLSISDSDIEKLHLDHMEPSTIQEHIKERYFEHDDRHIIVNGLGNMFPLPGTHNISKSNEPLKEAFKYIEKAGLAQHSLAKETERIFTENNINSVPTYEFFKSRKSLIKDLFYQAIRLDQVD